MAGLTIGKLAAAEGVGVETVRFYQRRGLLALPERKGSGYREYTESDRARLDFIRRARRLGFTLGEISDLLGPAGTSPAGTSPAGTSPAGTSPAGTSPAGTSTAAEIAKVASAKLAAIDEQVRELEMLRCRLRRLLHVCEHGSGQDCAALRLGEPAKPAPATATSKE
jgi:DNA-binding transcriptional MerR regulator